MELQKELFFCKISIKHDFDINQATMGKNKESLLDIAVNRVMKRYFYC